MLTSQKIADVLNEALKLDPAAVNSLFCVRRSCGRALLDHPHILVNVAGEPPGQRFAVGFLGLLNGMLSAAGSNDRIYMAFDEALNDPKLPVQGIPNYNILHFGVKPEDERIALEAAGAAQKSHR